MASTKLMLAIMEKYDADGMLSDLLTDDVIKKISDKEYIQDIAETIGHPLSIMELAALMRISQYRNDDRMRQFLQIIGFIIAEDVSIDELMDTIQVILAKKNQMQIEEIKGGVNFRRIGWCVFGMLHLYSLYTLGTYIKRSLDHRLASSTTVIGIMEMMENSNCPIPPLNPALQYLVDNNLLSKPEERMIIIAKQLDNALKGGCNPLEEQLSYVLFDEGTGTDMQKALIPVSFEEETSDVVSKQIKIWTEQTGKTPFQTYELIAKSPSYSAFKEQLDALQTSTTDKKPTTLLDVANYALDGLKDGMTLYWNDVKYFKMLNPIPMTDLWNEVQRSARAKIKYYKRLVEDGMDSMENAHRELFAYFKHMGILYVLFMRGVWVAIKYLRWIKRELQGKYLQPERERSNRRKARSRSISRPEPNSTALVRKGTSGS